MFNTVEVGRKIMTLRKEKNLTQTNFADEMGVSFQAVSNWERGNSMPDISKLPEIAKVLDCSIDYLLGHSNETQTIKSIINDDKDQVSLKDLESVAPILKPETVDDILEKKDKVDIKDIVSIAPFSSSHYLDQLVYQIDSQVSLDDIIELAPFLSESALYKISEGMITDLRFSDLSDIAPFLGSQYLDDLVNNRLDECTSEEASYFYPFLSNKSLDKVLDKIIELKKFHVVSDIAPFLSGKSISKLMNVEGIDHLDLYPFMSGGDMEILSARAIEEKNMELLEELAPHLNASTVDEIFNMAMIMDNMSLEALYPFISQKKLQELADKFMSDKDIKSLAGLAPFL